MDFKGEKMNIYFHGGYCLNEWGYIERTNKITIPLFNHGLPIPLEKIPFEDLKDLTVRLKNIDEIKLTANQLKLKESLIKIEMKKEKYLFNEKEFNEIMSGLNEFS